MNDSLFLNALNCRNYSLRPPVWLMRQAGRHLASYRALRSRYSFLEMCHEPELIAKVTFLPIDTYEMDAAVLFSDILVIPEAMGLGLRFEEQKGPIIERPISTTKDVLNLPSPDLSKLDYVAQGIRLLKTELSVPLLGFCGAPFTVASYMIEGKSSRDFKKTKRFMLSDPAGFHLLLRKITEWSTAYLKMQIEAGVNALHFFDSWANALSYHSFVTFSLAYLDLLMKGIDQSSDRAIEDNEIGESAIPVILFCRGSSVFAPDLAKLKPAGIGLDWNCHMPDIRKRVGGKICLQGNLDPDLLYAPLPVLERAVDQLLDEMEGDSGFIFNLGHGIAPDVSEEAVHVLVNCVKRRDPCLIAPK